MYANPLPILGAVFLLAGVTLGHAQNVRLGSDTPEITERLDLRKVTEWSMVSGMEGGDLGAYHVTTEPYAASETIRYTTVIEFILDEADRRPFYDRLFKRGYYANITPRGVSYQVEHSTDSQLRALTWEDAKTTTYVPHDCKRTLGACVYEKRVGERVSHYIRTSSFNDGIWRDSVAYDPARDPKERSDLVEESVFSVDAVGVLIDEETRRYSKFGTTLTRMTRLNFGKEDDPDPNLPPALTVPEGAYFSMDVTCRQSDRVTIVGGNQRAMSVTDRWATTNTPGDTVRMNCGPKNFSSGICSEAGHVIALASKGRLAFGCYTGPAPAE